MDGGRENSLAQLPAFPNNSNATKRPELSVAQTRTTRLVERKYVLSFSGKKELLCNKCNTTIQDDYIVSRVRTKKGRLRRVWSERSIPTVYYHVACWERLFL